MPSIQGPITAGGPLAQVVQLPRAGAGALGKLPTCRTLAASSDPIWLCHGHSGYWCDDRCQALAAPCTTPRVRELQSTPASTHGSEGTLSPTWPSMPCPPVPGSRGQAGGALPQPSVPKPGAGERTRGRPGASQPLSTTAPGSTRTPDPWEGPEAGPGVGCRPHLPPWAEWPCGTMPRA